MTTPTFRPFEADCDYPAIVAIHNLCWPDKSATVDDWREADQRKPADRYFFREVVEVDGRIVASASYFESQWEHVPGKYVLKLEVHPDYQRRGIATAWFDHALRDVLAQRDPVPILLSASTREDQPAALAMLAKHDFALKQRLPISRLDVTAFDPSPYASVLARVAENGIIIKRLSELQRTDTDWRRRVYDLEISADADTPSVEPITPPAFEVFAKMAFEGTAFRPDGWFIALDGNDYVGMTSIETNKALPHKLYTDFTGVRPSHRRMGIATALKVRSIEEFAKPYGATEIETENEENNPMYQINLRLGFQPAPAWLNFRKRLDDGE